jgi:hypothetical protein
MTYRPLWSRPFPARGCLVTKSADQTAADYTTSTAVAWDLDVYDTDNIHDTVTQNTRLVVPSGVTKVRLSYSVFASSVTAGSELYCTMAKNGAVEWVGTPLEMMDTDKTDPRATGTSAVIAVTPGDYFELFVQVLADSSVTIEANYSWFSMEIVEMAVPYTSVDKGYKGALVRKAADLTGQNFTTATTLSWNQEAYNTDNFHSNVTNNTRLTVPAGVNKVRLSAALRLVNQTSGTYAGLLILKNGSLAYDGVVRHYSQISATAENLTATGPVIQVTPGDYFEMQAHVLTDTSVDVDSASTWFAIEVIESVFSIPTRDKPIAFFFTFRPDSLEPLLLFSCTEAVTLADDFAGSVGHVGTNPGLSFVMDVQKNGSSIGSITISTGGIITFATTGTTVNLVPGDQLKVLAPAATDGSIANVSITLKAGG